MKKFAFVLLTAVMAFSLCVTVYAADSVDLNEIGSVSISMKSSDGESAGGTVALYRVADIIWAGETYAFDYTEDFKNCTYALDDLESPEVAVRFADYAVDENASALRADVIDGTVLFEDLSVGIYLAIHENAADGFSESKPFFVTLPIADGDSWDYTVDASPKVNIEREDVSSPDNIPQTGQLKWPIPVMAAAGVLLLAIGVILLRRCKTR